jgi:hypothetical protein
MFPVVEIAMRNLVTTGLLGFCLGAFGVPSMTTAQEPTYEVTDEPQIAPQPRLTRSQQLVQERAAIKAQYRTARIESHKWTGQSPLRPVMQTGLYTDGNVIRLGYVGFYGPIYAPPIVASPIVP